NTASGSLPGDINADGSVDARDVKLIQRYLVKQEQFTQAQFLAADVNGDGQADIFDLALLKRMALHS
ncbi:MAG: dockerin type I repeat-containing protein, partial [Oscillospiraceae bacterium]|nr:dockerin type I repeat-containing protein [Oscillospiraceae bacterium]